MSFIPPIVSQGIANITSTFPETFHFIVHSSKFYDKVIFDGLFEALLKLVVCVGNLIHALFTVLYFLGIITLKLLFLGYPHCVKIGKAVIKFHRTQLGFWDVVVEVVVISVILIYLIFRKRIAAAWKRLETDISKKSKTLARMLPHILFFSCAALLAFFGNKFLVPFTSTRVLPLFTMVIPLLRTVNVIRKEQVAAYRDVLVMWIVLGMYYAVCMASDSIPFSGTIIRFLPTLREFTLVVSYCTPYISIFYFKRIVVAGGAVDSSLSGVCEYRIRVN
jgi:hypothetical protein